MTPSLHRLLLLFLLLAPTVTAGQPPTSAPALSQSPTALLIKPDQHIVFLGDSSTQLGWTSASGFIHLVVLGLANQNVPVTALQFGTQGSRPQELFDLYQTKIASMNPKPQWLVLGCGLDAVSQRLPGSDIATFQTNMKSLVDAAKSAGIQVVVMTTGILTEQAAAPDEGLTPYNDALRALATSENCPLADVNAAEKAALPTTHLLHHGPQLNTHGQRVVAREILKALGVTPTQQSEIETAWLDAPKSAPGAPDIRLKATTPITLRQYNDLESQLISKHQSLQGKLNAVYAADVLSALRAADASSDVASVENAAQTAFAKDVAGLLQNLPSPATSPTSASAAGGDLLVKSGQKVAFLGDSITAFGWSHPDGYVKLVVSGLAGVGVQVQPIPAGISGNTSRDMLARLQKSVIDQKPDWMTLSCGVNDVWHGITGCDLPTYQKNITAIVDQAQQANIQVMILTSTMIQETDNPFTAKQVPYNEFLRQLAHDRKLPLADLNVAMHDQLKATPGRHLTVDGVHMNPAGNQMMAIGVLKAFGLSDAQLAQAQDHWLDAPAGAIAEGDLVVMPSPPITLRQSDALEKLAAANKQTLADYLAPLYLQSLAAQSKANPTQSNLTAIQTAAQSSFAQHLADLTR